MNAIALFLMLVSNGNMTCGAEIPNQTMLGDQVVQVQVFDCYWSEKELASHQFVVISPVCPTYVAQPVIIKEIHAHKGWVMSQFGEFYPATTNIDMMNSTVRLAESSLNNLQVPNVSSTGGKSSSEKKSARLGFFLGYA